MTNKPTEPTIVAFSVRVYQVCLAAYPTKFRQEYGLQMVQVFQDCCLRAVRQGGRNGMGRLWAVTLLDLIHSVISEYRHRLTDISKTQFIKLSGWTFILGAFAFLATLGGESNALAASVISSILLAVGMLGMRARYGSAVGGFGRDILLIGVIVTVLAYIVVVYLFVVHFGILPVRPIQAPIDFNPESLWILLFAGPAILLLALTLFGMAALRSKPMERLNWLPAFAGIWYPILYFFLAGYTLTHDGAMPEQFPWIASNMMISIQAIALCVLGFVLITDAPREMARA